MSVGTDMTDPTRAVNAVSASGAATGPEAAPADARPVDGTSHVIGDSSLPFPAGTIGAALHNAALQWPDRDALVSVEQNRHLSWAALDRAATALAAARAAWERTQSARTALQASRDAAATALAGAKAEHAGVDREYQALLRDREARARQSASAQGRVLALDRLRAAPGYERALAAVLGRDAKSPLGPAPAGADGRFWSGANAPAPVADSLAAHVRECPLELAARLALVHCVDDDDSRVLGPGEWLVTRAGALRRWDGFVARGEGAAEAARLEAENRFAALAEQLPALAQAVASAESEASRVGSELAAMQTAAIAAERAVAQASEAERATLRALDAAEDARSRLAARRAELAAAATDLAEQQAQAQEERAAALAARAALPPPDAGRAALVAARSAHEGSRLAVQSANAALAAQDQALAQARERAAARAADIRGWQARAGDAARRLAEMTRRFSEIEEERAVVAAKPEGLRREIEQGESIRSRIAAEMAEAEAAVAQATEAARFADRGRAATQEALASAREDRAGAAARAEHEDQRRADLARLSGERFTCPPPLLAERFAFAPSDIAAAEVETAAMDGLVNDRDRLGPVNLVAADELTAAEARAAEGQSERADLAEAVARLRGSIGNLNREGRERLRTAFEAVDGHVRRLFTRLFQGGQAHLALVDSDDPLEAGLEIFAQPPGKRLQSLTLLSGGEQALTAIALIFALFLTNPAPICVLDEVDAPLDDANIERFCDLLEAMSQETDTRYLIVTHNAVTMSRMHRLFGVTMVEQGISRLVSVDLGGAEKLLAAE